MTVSGQDGISGEKVEDQKASVSVVVSPLCQVFVTLLKHQLVKHSLRRGVSHDRWLRSDDDGPAAILHDPLKAYVVIENAVVNQEAIEIFRWSGAVSV